MPASIVIAHDDPEFVENTAMALRDAGFDVAAFVDSMSALHAVEAAQRLEILITRVQFPDGQPNGVSLGLMARMKRPEVKVLFVARPERETYTEDVGELLPTPAEAAEVVETVRKMLAVQV